MRNSRQTRKSLTKTVAVSTGMKDKVYKIFTESEWKAFQKTGRFKGSADDRRDGFIHLSTKEQLGGVIERFYSGKRPLYVAEFSSDNFLQRLKWEASDSMDIYPHLYGFDVCLNELGNFVKLDK